MLTCTNCPSICELATAKVVQNAYNCTAEHKNSLLIVQITLKMPHSSHTCKSLIMNPIQYTSKGWNLNFIKEPQNCTVKSYETSFRAHNLPSFMSILKQNLAETQQNKTDNVWLSFLYACLVFLNLPLWTWVSLSPLRLVTILPARPRSRNLPIRTEARVFSTKKHGSKTWVCVLWV